MRELGRISRQNLWMLLALVAVDLFAYYGTRLLHGGAVYHDMALPLDRKIPFVPAMILPYVTAFVQWLACLWLLARESTPFCRYYVLGLVIAELICAACFLCWPTRMFDRPTPTGRDVFSRLTALVFAADSPPENLFPSLHCVLSWVCLRMTLASALVSRPLRAANAVLTALIVASVVLVKQHVVIDIPAGIAVAELGLLLARLCLKLIGRL